MPGSSNPEPSSASSVWSAAQESSTYFSHTAALQAGLVVALAFSAATLWMMMHLPFATARLFLSTVPLVVCVYLSHRLYLSLISVELFSDRLELRQLGKITAVPYASITKIHFDSFSHDLMVCDADNSYRIPRTIQGHRVILHRLHQRVEVARDHSPEMTVDVRLLPKVACVVSITSMVVLSLVVFAQMPQIGVGLLLFSIPLTYMLLDQCIVRSYHFTPDELRVKGLRGVKIYPRADLKDAWIDKSGLSSRIQMTFAEGRVQFDEYLLSKALIQVSGFIERRWQQRVTPLSSRN